MLLTLSADVVIESIISEGFDTKNSPGGLTYGPSTTAVSDEPLSLADLLVSLGNAGSRCGFYSFPSK